MATVTVLKFATTEEATNALNRVHDLQEQHLIKLHDVAIVSWPVSHVDIGNHWPPLVH